MNKSQIKMIEELQKSKKICLFGCPGSGKSTLSKKLANILNINVYHLDNIYWKPNWVNISKEEFDDKLNELLYNHSYFANSMSLTTVPIYYLQPNKKIAVQSKDAKISGLYTLDKITLPLTYNGTMSITATKAAEKII